MSKRNEKKLRDLAALAHERALAHALDKLYAEFELWRNGALNAFDLNQSIHEFHNKTARKIYSFYAGAEPRLVVSAAARDEILTREEIGDELLSELGPTLELLKRTRE